jgi:predicted ATPase/transcriptional regulator with XRE-family HTH domain
MERTETTGAVDLGALLRHFREARGLSQEELAERARPGLSVDTISKIERGRSRPYRHTLEALCTALDLTPAERAAVAAARRIRPGVGAATRSPTRDGVPAPAEAGPERSPGARALAAPLTPLVGREHEEAAIAGLLQREGLRLLTLTGPGGVGKTRLAQQVAVSLRMVYADGVAWVDLAPLRDPDLVLPSIGHALGLREVGRRSLEEQLYAHLRARRALLVLDNFEHVAAAGPALADLLEACPGVTALVTSRAALRVRGEHEFDVAPLALPEPGDAAQPALLLRVPAVALFVQRARALRSTFALAPENAPDVAAICARLDGLPLALELAAARLTIFSPRALRARLERRLPLLVSGARDLPERQRTMRDTIAWSDELLDAPVRALFRRLAVFSGGCTVEAVEKVCADGELPATVPPVDDVSAGLHTLLDQSLVRRDDRDESEPRVVMLETIREYALERLSAHNEDTLLRRRHAVYYVILAEEAEPALRGGQEQGNWLDRLEREHDNFRAALEWTRQNGAVALGLRLAGALSWFWRMHGHMAEGRKWLDELLAQKHEKSGTSEREEEDIAAPVRAKALTGAGRLALEQGDYGPSTVLNTEGLYLWRAVGSAIGSAEALRGLGQTAYYQGQFVRATSLHEQSLVLYEESGDTVGKAMALTNLGLVACMQGDVGRAEAVAEEANALLRGSSDAYGPLIALALAALHRPDNGRAIALCERALSLCRDLGFTYGAAVVVNLHARARHNLGEEEHALALCEHARTLYQDVGSLWGRGHVLGLYGQIYAARGEREQAIALFRETLSLGRAIGTTWNVPLALEGLAAVACATVDAPSYSEVERAARLLGAAHGLRAAIRMPLPPFDRPAHERTVAALHVALGQAGVAAAWAVGESLSQQQAVDYALRLCSPRSASTPPPSEMAPLRARRLPPVPDG